MFIKFSILAVMVALCGCAAVVSELPPEQLPEEQQKNPGYQLSRALVADFIRNDFKSFRSRLSVELQKDFTESEFRKFRQVAEKTLGEPVSFRYLSALEFVSVTPHIWKIRFRRTGTRTRETVYRETLMRVITGTPAKGQICVLGFSFL